MSYSDAEDRFVDILKIIGEEGARLGIRLAVEPLNRDETNFINTVGEATRIAARVLRRKCRKYLIILMKMDKLQIRKSKICLDLRKLAPSRSRSKCEMTA